MPLGSEQRTGGLVVGREQVIEALAEISILASFPVQKLGTIAHVGQVKGGVEHGFDAMRVERH